VYGYRILKANLEHGVPFDYRPTYTVDWTDLVIGVLDDVKRNETIPSMSLKFHNTLCAIIVDVAKLCGEQRVVLSGGCFQNKYLTERTIATLRAEGFQPYWHQRVPPNDGGIALGQIYACMRNTHLKQQPSPEHDHESILTIHHLIEEETAG
jgi:hydrogenase maturation protein HypF